VFDRLYQRGQRLHGTWMTLRCLAAEPPLLKPDRRDHNPSSHRVAVVVSSKVSKRAVQRNRLRRLLHGHVSSLLRLQPPGAGQWLLISLKPGSETADAAALLGECSTLLARAGLQP
jgi:ribonuclease P protein component